MSGSGREVRTLGPFASREGAGTAVESSNDTSTDTSSPMNIRFKVSKHARLDAERRVLPSAPAAAAHRRRSRRALGVGAPLCALLAPLPVAVALAATEREHGAHEHGAASLDAVLFDDRVELVLDSPWANLVGFEHTPSSDEDRATVDAALADLESAEALAGALPAAAGCTLGTVNSASTMGAVEEGQHDDEHHGDEEHADGEHGDEAHHDGDERHGDEQHAASDHGDEGDHRDEEHERGESTHSEIEVEWQFVCDDPAALDAIDLAALRERFPSIETLTVQLAGPGGQSSATLGEGETRLDLEAIR